MENLRFGVLQRPPNLRLQSTVAGLQNEKLNLLFLANETAQIVIKTSSGKTDRINIHNSVMQGTVWGGLICTKHGKKAYADPQLLYKYRGHVEVPPLEWLMMW